MRQLTGSSTVLNLLNHFGHCMSHEYVLRHETALGQVNISSEGALPPGFSKHEFTTIAWDNDNFCEETKTGKGTTHVTGGIIIQRQSYEAEESERASIPRSSSLKLVPDEIAPYLPGKRVTLDLKEALDGVSIDECDYLTTQKTAKIFDLSLVLCRSLQDEYLFPNWTGFNTLLQSREIPVLSKVGYLPVINAPPTEMSTINAIEENKNKLNLNIAKTEYVLIGSRHRINSLDIQPSINIDKQSVKRVKHSKVLGVQIDEHLAWTKHIEFIAGKISSGIGAIKKAKEFVD